VPQRQALSEGRFVDLNDRDPGSLEIGDFVADG
jgi:hypothetical protein